MFPPQQGGNEAVAASAAQEQQHTSNRSRITIEDGRAQRIADAPTASERDQS
jgi:hypothetical protein